ncbi:hypothetical protein [Mesorhizobium sp. M0040]|uniref:hypothetical protein n=1 Tax=Mesorhizobium sp. M0040 TaxID=2956855 RepID=UPI003337AEE3
MKLALTPPPFLARFASLPSRYRIAQDRLLELDRTGRLRAITGLEFVQRLIDARAELDNPQNGRNARTIQLALQQFEREVAAFEEKLVEIDARLQLN